ncbi:MAG: dephospho-CoA kinase [Alphaproteobacteria bacterium]
MIVIGLTGSIGMGKSTVAQMFARLGVPAHDSDAAVHDLMRPGQKGYLAVAASFPYFEYPEIYKKRQGPLGKMRYIDRAEFGKLIFADPEKRKMLENILHPLVRKAQNDFIADMRRMGKNIVLLDIPLLFETDAHLSVDVAINVEAPLHIQSARVLARPNMSAEKFAHILQSQMPSAEKSLYADYVIKTGLSRAATFSQVRQILDDIQQDAQFKYKVEPEGRIY